MSRRKDGNETKSRILEVAGRLFAEKGYDKTIHEEICRLADVNIGAINYHFQSKENLYREAWRHAFHESIAKHPIDGGVPKDATPIEKLRGHILSFMHRIADPENIEFDIMYRDMANPSGFLSEAVQKTMPPLRDNMRAIISELLGGKASERDLQLCEMSIMGQCFNPIIMDKHFKKLRSGSPDSIPTDFDIESMADHIIRFSMAGLKEIRRQIERSKK